MNPTIDQQLDAIAAQCQANLAPHGAAWRELAESWRKVAGDMRDTDPELASRAMARAETFEYCANETETPMTNPGAAEAGWRTTIAAIDWAKASHSAMLGIEIVSAWDGKARIGCRLHYKGEYVPKKQHEHATINVA